MKNHHLWIAFSLLFLLSLVFTGCGTEISDEEELRVLRVRLESDIKNLDPAFIVGGYDDTVSRLVMESLTRYIPNSPEPINYLAEWIEVSEDGLEVHFKLIEGVMWHEGYGELTTEDVKFSFERFKDPELDAVYKDDWISLDRVEIIDDYEGIIYLSEPQATLFTTTMPLTSGRILCKAYVEEVGLEEFATNIIGSGPYLFDEWTPGNRVVLKKNPEYWGEEPYWDVIYLYPIEENAAAEVALEAGEVDFSRVTIASVDRLEANPDLTVLVVPTNSYSWIGMNLDNPKLQDINIRQAIRYGIDVQGILDAAYMGKAERAHSLLTKNVIGYWEDAPVYERDLEKAREYMEIAGLESLDLKLTIQNTMEYRTWAEIIQSNLAEIGINIEIEALEPSAYWAAGEGDEAIYNVEIFGSTFTAMSDPAWFTMWFTSDQVGVYNWMRWDSPEYDELHRRGLSTVEIAEREEIYIEMQKLWDEAVHTVWLTHDPRPYAHYPAIIPAMYPNGIIPMIDYFRLSE